MGRIGFIGLGLMGKPMALNLLKKGFSLTVHNRSQAPVDALVAAGAAAAASPAEVAAASEVIITMVPDSPDVRRVLQGPNGVFEAVREGSIIVDMSTIAPAVARELAAEATLLGVAGCSGWLCWTRPSAAAKSAPSTPRFP
jgi:2-hydroxy-3-oxopropionate reductase